MSTWDFINTIFESLWLNWGFTVLHFGPTDCDNQSIQEKKKDVAFMAKTSTQSGYPCSSWVINCPNVSNNLPNEAFPWNKCLYTFFLLLLVKTAIFFALLCVWCHLFNEVLYCCQSYYGAHCHKILGFPWSIVAQMRTFMAYYSLKRTQENSALAKGSYKH